MKLFCTPGDDHNHDFPTGWLSMVDEWANHLGTLPFQAAPLGGTSGEINPWCRLDVDNQDRLWCFGWDQTDATWVARYWSPPNYNTAVNVTVTDGGNLDTKTPRGWDYERVNDFFMIPRKSPDTDQFVIAELSGSSLSLVSVLSDPATVLNTGGTACIAIDPFNYGEALIWNRETGTDNGFPIYRYNWLNDDVDGSWATDPITGTNEDAITAIDICPRTGDVAVIVSGTGGAASTLGFTLLHYDTNGNLLNSEDNSFGGYSAIFQSCYDVKWTTIGERYIVFGTSERPAPPKHDIWVFDPVRSIILGESWRRLPTPWSPTAGTDHTQFTGIALAESDGVPIVTQRQFPVGDEGTARGWKFGL